VKGRSQRRYLDVVQLHQAGMHGSILEVKRRRLENTGANFVLCFGSVVKAGKSPPYFPSASTISFAALPAAS
jgi:hypothetical protein